MRAGEAAVAINLVGFIIIMDCLTVIEGVEPVNLASMDLFLRRSEYFPLSGLGI